MRVLPEEYRQGATRNGAKASFFLSFARLFAGETFF
jgi:hypothetical protein